MCPVTCGMVPAECAAWGAFGDELEEVCDAPEKLLAPGTRAIALV